MEKNILLTNKYVEQLQYIIVTNHGQHNTDDVAEIVATAIKEGEDSNFWLTIYHKLLTAAKYAEQSETLLEEVNDMLEDVDPNIEIDDDVEEDDDELEDEVEDEEDI
jgi:hypothetical protein